MKKIKATFRIVTPMFLGGADQSPSDGIRPPSVKGALRFWWRALNWGRFRQQTESYFEALGLLHKEEVRLFGAAAKQVDGKDAGGQGCFMLRVSSEPLTCSNKGEIHRQFSADSAPAARYLGYGLMVAFDSKISNKKGGQLERGCLNENQEFTVTLAFRKEIEASVREAVLAFGLMGSLGSRARHGLGSVALLSLETDEMELWRAPNNADDYASEIRQLLLPGTLSHSEPPFSAFWRDSRVEHLLTASDCYGVLNDFGKAMLMYRSWGKGGEVLKVLSEKRFKDDHDWFRNAKAFTKEHPNFHPVRVTFGLPHNYGQKDYHVTPSQHERRASPLLYHVHSIDKKFIGIAIYLPCQFLPEGEQINANGDNVPANINWSVITDFLDNKVGNPPAPDAAARFPAKKAILP